MADDEKDGDVAVADPEEKVVKKKATKSAAAADVEESFVEPVSNGDAEEKPSVPQFAKDIAKALGAKSKNVTGFNEQTKVVVLDNGGKYQLSKNGKALRHLGGPPPPADMKLEVVDARTRPVFVGTAAAINASVHEGSSDEELLAEKADLEARLAEVNEQLEA